MEIILLLFYLLFIALIVEISAILFTLTGLSEEISRYQAISMLTNTGFTTDEANLIIEHPVRRKISSFLILFGAFSLAVVISIISTYLSDDIQFLHIGISIALISTIYLLLKTTLIRNYLKKKLQADLNRTFEIDELPVKDVLYCKEGDLFIEIPINKDSSFVDLACQSICNKEDDINLLFLKRGSEMIRSNFAEEFIREGDLLYVYGDKKQITRKFIEELIAADLNNIK